MYLKLQPRKPNLFTRCLLCGFVDLPQVSGSPVVMLATDLGTPLGHICKDCLGSGKPEHLAEKALSRAGALQREADLLAGLAPLIAKIPPDDSVYPVDLLRDAGAG